MLVEINDVEMMIELYKDAGWTCYVEYHHVSSQML